MMASIVAIGPNPALRVRMQLRGLEDSELREVLERESDDLVRLEAAAEIERRANLAPRPVIAVKREVSDAVAALPPARRRVYDLLEQRPLTSGQISINLDISYETARNHLTALLNANLVRRTGHPPRYEAILEDAKPELTGFGLTDAELNAWLAADEPTPAIAAVPEPEEPTMATEPIPAQQPPRTPPGQRTGLSVRILEELERGPATLHELAARLDAPYASTFDAAKALLASNRVTRDGEGRPGLPYVYRLAGDDRSLEREVDEDAGEPDPDADLEAAPQTPEVTPQTPEIPAAPAPAPHVESSAPHVESSAPTVAPTILEDRELVILSRCSRALEELRALDEDAQHRARRYLLDRHFDLGARPA